MSESIKSVGFNNTPLYGTRKATFVLDGMDDCGKKSAVAKFLWNGLSEAEKKNIGTIYESMWKRFCKGNISENMIILSDRQNISNVNGLYSEIVFGHDVFLLSEFLDTKRGLRVTGTSIEYTQVFWNPAVVAGVRNISEKNSTLVVNSWHEGIGFDPSFLYCAGEKFGRLVKGGSLTELDKL